jgi:uncharacterized protein HemX
MEGTVKKASSAAYEEGTCSEIPSTPRKKPKYPPSEQSSVRRIKTYTQMKERESVSLIYVLLVFLWLLAAAFVLFMSFQTKLRAAEADAHKAISQCKADFETNRYPSPYAAVSTPSRD